MKDGVNKLLDEIAKQHKLTGFTAAEWDRLGILKTDYFAQMTKLAESSAPYTEALQQLTANLENLYPLKSIQAALASIELPQMPQMSAALQAHLAGINGIGASFAKNLEEGTRLLLDAVPTRQYHQAFEQTFKQVSLAERMSVDLPHLAATVWPSELAGHRIALLEDAVSNAAALRELETSAVLSSAPLRGIERVGVAAELVWNHGTFVRRLPPTLPDAPRHEAYRAEELGSKLETKLQEIDPRLLELRREAWKNLANGKVGSRLAAHGVREIFGELLRLFAPDEKVKQTDAWVQRKDQTLAKPTRRMRFEFIVGASAADLAALLQFDESVQNANKFAHIFEENIEVVRAHLAQLEACMYLLITYAEEGGSSS